ncbi:non-homologous end-joining factor 1 [Aegotheles albertisi]
MEPPGIACAARIDIAGGSRGRQRFLVPTSCRGPAPAPSSLPSLPQMCGAREGPAFASALRQLYTAVTQQEVKQARKRQRSEDTEDPGPTAETTEHPCLLLPSQEDETASCSEGTTPASSPAQKSRLPAAKAKPKKAKGLFS